MNQLMQLRNKRGEQVLVVVDKTWDMAKVHDTFFRQGVDLTGFKYVKSMDLFEFDLDAKPGDWWKKPHVPTI